MIMEEIQVSYEEANQLLQIHGSVRNAVDFYNNNK
jgi:N-acetylmuramic acid 6-phosphate etherase